MALTPNISLFAAGGVLLHSLLEISYCTNTQSNTKYGGTSCQNFNRYAYQIRFMLLLLMSKYPPPHLTQVPTSKRCSYCTPNLVTCSYQGGPAPSSYSYQPPDGTVEQRTDLHRGGLENRRFPPPRHPPEIGLLTPSVRAHTLLGHNYCAACPKFQQGLVGWGMLGKSGHFRRGGRTWAYEHRLGPNSVRKLCTIQGYSPLPLDKAYKVPGVLF